jgi:hypothetical protein
MVKTAILTLGTAIALSFISMLHPLTAVAQSQKDCTRGSGLYSCDFKNEAGHMALGFLGLSLTQNFSAFNASILPGNATSLFLSGDCDCGVKGNLGNDKPLKSTKEVTCLGSDKNFDALLVGKIVGNPNTRKVKGQLHLWNINATTPSAWIYECKPN